MAFKPEIFASLTAKIDHQPQLSDEIYFGELNPVARLGMNEPCGGRPPQGSLVQCYRWSDVSGNVTLKQRGYRKLTPAVVARMIAGETGVTHARPMIPRSTAQPGKKCVQITTGQNPWSEESHPYHATYLKAMEILSSGADYADDED